MDEANKKINLRDMRMLDVGEVYEIECRCFTQPWSTDSLIGELTRNDIAHYVVAECENHIIGYAGMWVMCGEAHMTNIAVDEAFRCQGIATNLILYLMRKAESCHAATMTLEVRENNYRAQRVYYALGFRYAGTRRKYYSDTGEDALILWNEDILNTLLKTEALKK